MKLFQTVGFFIDLIIEVILSLILLLLYPVNWILAKIWYKLYWKNKKDTYNKRCVEKILFEEGFKLQVIDGFSTIIKQIKFNIIHYFKG